LAIDIAETGALKLEQSGAQATVVAQPTGGWRSVIFAHGTKMLSMAVTDLEGMSRLLFPLWATH